MMARCWPHPLLSLFLLATWLLLVNDLSFGHWLLGGFLGWGIPQLTQAFWVSAPRIRRPLKLVGFLLMVVGDIIVANLQVARLILSPTRRLHPAFVEVPMELEDELALTMLASIATLTPGTVSADLSDDRRTLLVHGLDVGDEAELVASIKSRYEAPLKAIFACSTT